MPIPAAPDRPTDVASSILALFGQLHDQLRAETADLDDGDLNWTPGPGTNSIATIVTHILGSEAETLRAVAGIGGGRDRDGEFGGGPRRRAELAGALAAADALLTELRPAITPGRLRTLLALPTLPAEARRTGLTWLVGNYGHAREHVGHIQLTRQLRRSG